MSEIIRHIGKVSFIERYPILFSLIVVVGIEASMWGLGIYDIPEMLSSNAGRLVLVWVLKIIVMLALTYTFLYFRLKSSLHSKEK